MANSTRADDPRRTRDPAGRRAAIVRAARDVFAERGYARGTVREIARRAGVTHGLVTMHFGSKENLFLEVAPGTRALADLVVGDRSGLAARVAAGYVQRMEAGERADPFLALVRSVASDEGSATALLRAMQAESVAAYETVLPGPDVSIRVDLIGALLIGVTFSRYVVGAGPLASLRPEALTEYLTTSLETIMGDPAAGPAPSSDHHAAPTGRTAR